MFDVLVTNTGINFAEDVEMGEDGNDWNRHQAKYWRLSHLLDWSTVIISKSGDQYYSILLYFNTEPGTV